MTRVDQLFNRCDPGTGGFSFDDNVAEVFDDMIERSVPLYREVQQLLPTLAGLIEHRPLRVIDLGCSTGTSLIQLAEALPEMQLELIGIDSSEPMLRRCREKIRGLGLEDRISVYQEDIRTIEYDSVSLVLMNYTLQFVPIDDRLPLLKRVRQALLPGGYLVLSEKFVHEDVQLDQSLVELYFDFKRRNGYSELEIARKREALENVLVPYSVQENIRLLNDAGFDDVELILKWFNFGTLLGQAT